MIYQAGPPHAVLHWRGKNFQRGVTLMSFEAT